MMLYGKYAIYIQVENRNETPAVALAQVELLKGNNIILLVAA